MADYELIIFDCDGVVVDSEPLAAAAMAELLAELGRPEMAAKIMARFNGRKVAEWVGEIEQELGEPIADWFIPAFRERSAEKFQAELKPVPGIEEVLWNLRIPYCIASSGPPEKIALTLGLTGLRRYFEGRIFSGYEVGSWKPDPGLFLHAARAFGALPGECAVIEDSIPGVQAGLAAGMQVFHFDQGGSAPFALPNPAQRFTAMAELPGLLEL